MVSTGKEQDNKIYEQYLKCFIKLAEQMQSNTDKDGGSKKDM